MMDHNALDQLFHVDPIPEWEARIRSRGFPSVHRIRDPLQIVCIKPSLVSSTSCPLSVSCSIQ
ncbi:hypothetical protein BT69DRAFT_1283555 [Atractiella rhizophila]|nr:hypothetical protein BT69DRAFT_1283555 [Atractiella rhizophila]